MRKSVKVFGLIDYETGRTFYDFIDEKINSASFINFLKTVLTSTRSHLLLIQDGAKYHHAEEVLRFLDEKKKRVTPFKLPRIRPRYPVAAHKFLHKKRMRKT
ncbi:MAG: transposase [Oligoflexus sp.]|nr:transposase [Oligoflexus sp.]